MLIGEVGGEPGDVPVLVDDQASAQQTPHRHAHEVLVVIFHLGGLHSVGGKIKLRVLKSCKKMEIFLLFIFRALNETEINVMLCPNSLLSAIKYALEV